MSTKTIESPPSFTVRDRDAEELGDLFIETAMRILANSSGASRGQVVDMAIRTAAQFVETIAEIQDQQRQQR